MSLPSRLLAGALAVLLSACGGGDTWYDGTATVRTILIRDTTKPVTSTADIPAAVDDRSDEGGYHVNILGGDAVSCYLTPIDMVAAGSFLDESFANPPSGTFTTTAGPASATRVSGSGWVGSDGSRALNLTFAIQQEDSSQEAFSGTVMLVFNGTRRAGQ